MGKQKMNEKGIPYGARKKMPLWYSVAWSSRGISVAIAAIIMMQITFYSTDVLGLNPAVLGTLFFVSKIVDAFTDLGFGYILDKTHTRFGKARPYEWFIVLEWLFLVLMFNVPKIGATGQYIWIFIMYVIVNAVCATVLGGNDSVYLARTFTSHKNQVSVIAVNGFVVMFVSIAFNIVFPRWLANEGITQAGWKAFMIPLGIAMAVIGILRFFVCKEVAIEEKKDDKKKEQQNLSMKETIKILSKNKYLFLVLALMFLTFWANNMSAATTYYFKYIVGDIALQGTLAITGMIVIPAIVLFPILSEKIGTTKILQGCLLIGTIGIGIRTIGGTNIVTLIIGGMLAGIGTLPISMMINTYLIDCMDYGEWKTGIRIEGLVASICNFASKVGMGIGMGAVGFVMGIVGYDGLVQTQNAGVNNAIIFLYNILPLILFGIMFVISLFYKVDSVRPQMDEDLKKKHEEA